MSISHSDIERINLNVLNRYLVTRYWDVRMKEFMIQVIMAILKHQHIARNHVIYEYMRIRKHYSDGQPYVFHTFIMEDLASFAMKVIQSLSRPRKFLKNLKHINSLRRDISNFLYSYVQFTCPFGMSLGLNGENWFWYAMEHIDTIFRSPGGAIYMTGISADESIDCIIQVAFAAHHAYLKIGLVLVDIHERNIFR